jgi:hypothetical protein
MENKEEIIKKASISKNIYFENLMFWGIGLITFFSFKFFGNSYLINVLLLFILASIFDTGHIWITYTRLTNEFKYVKWLIIAPFLAFILLFYFANTDYFYVFITYFAWFHYLKQIYGINRWYMKKENENITPTRNNIVFVITLIPLLIVSLRDINLGDYGFQLIHFDSFCNKCVIKTLNFLFIISVIYWLFEEHLLSKKEKINMQRVLFILGNAILYYLVANYSTNFYEILIPILLTHGTSYYLALYQFEKNIKKTDTKRIIYSMLFFGVIGGLIMNEMYDVDMFYDNKILLSLLFTPLITHYLIDMIIWRNDYLNFVLNKIKGDVNE